MCLLSLVVNKRGGGGVGMRTWDLKMVVPWKWLSLEWERKGKEGWGMTGGN